MNISRTKKLSVKLSVEELERWHRAADGESLAVFVRLLVNDVVRERLRSFGEGDEAVIAAPAASPSPEERLLQETGPNPFSDVPFEDEPFEPVNPEIEEPPVGPVPTSSAGALLDPNCDLAEIHWQIRRGGHCPHCDGVAT